MRQGVCILFCFVFRGQLAGDVTVACRREFPLGDGLKGNRFFWSIGQGLGGFFESKKIRAIRVFS